VRILLDTCTFLSLTATPDRITVKVSNLFRKLDNAFFLSVASAWKIAIKYKIGQLDLPAHPPSIYLPERLQQYRLRHLEITLGHVIEAGALHIHHSDPFDRLLIAQAKMEGLTVAKPDATFSFYDVPVIW
jgi:PIN domain nuclease of toxin-antitoxin system